MQLERELPQPPPTRLREEHVARPSRWPLHSGRFELAAPQARSRRIEAIDATRGLLMIAIAWSHALANLVPTSPIHAVANPLLSGTMGFTTISGLMVGWFSIVQRHSFARIERRYAVQAARLVFLVHPLLVFAMFSATGEGSRVLRSLFITDTLAVLFWLVVPAIPALGPRRCVQLGLGALIANAIAGPAFEAVPLLHDILCGVDPQGPHVLSGSYGLLPLTGAFLIGSWFGVQLAAARTDEARRAFGSQLARWGIVLLVGSAVLVEIWLVARKLGAHDLAGVLYPDYEQSLYPFYAGATLLVLSVLLRMRNVPAILVHIGKASLFIYVAQYILAWTIPALLGWYGGLGSLGYALLCLALVPLLGVFAWAWNLWRRG
jgi:uncharacterized membrane protein